MMRYGGLEEFDRLNRLEQDARRKELVGKGDPDEFDRLNKSASWILIAIAFAAAFFCLSLKVASGAERQRSPGLVKVTQETPSLRGTVQSIGSGICVSPDGWIVTAAHVVDADDKCTVTFDGATNSQTAAIVKRDRRSDIAVLKIEVGEPVDCVSVAEVAPPKGTVVYSEGYPAGQYARMEGSVNSVQARHFGVAGVLFNQRSTVQTIETTHRLQQGNSGGPLYNADGEVIGIASTVPVGEQNVASYFVGTQEIHIALTQCGAKGWKKQSKRMSKLLPKAWVIGAKDCAACNHLKSDLGTKRRAGARPDLTAFVNQHWRVRYIDKKNASKIIQKHRLKGELPVIMAANIPGQALYGYTDADTLMATLNEVLAKAPQNDQIEFEVGPDDGLEYDMDGTQWFDESTELERQNDGYAQANPAPPSVRRTTPSRPPQAPPSAPPRRPTPNPAPQPEELEGNEMEPEPVPGQNGDLSEVTAVVLVKKSVPGVAGKLVGYVEEHATGKLTDAINSALAEKATVRIIFERSNPTKYAAILEAAGLSGDSLGKVLLVAPKKFDGIAAALVSKVEAALDGLKHSALKGLPVSAVFERTEEDSYAEVITALGKEGGSSSEGGSGNSGWLYALLAALGLSDGGLSGIYSRFFGKKGGRG